MQCIEARTVFLSDLHLGSPNCHAQALVDFLGKLHAQRVYLVGDIIDLWWMQQRRAHFDRHQAAVFESLRLLARRGTELIYIPGNHDRPLREFCGLVLPKMTVRRDAIHRCADGRRYLVTHGDDFDGAVQAGGWQEWLGDHLYDYILAGNRVTQRMRQKLGMRYWSLAEFIKRQSVLAERYIDRYVEAAVTAATDRGLDGVICGHIHRAALLERRGIVYANDGDWVESMTAISEDAHGQLALLRWTGKADVLAELPPHRLLAAA
ncbi:MAG TPA: UDP-2,3-diacylglucosamine diphosphatase [Xanthomonadales bacterium]|nr:UDP-2,3-diacylglucosamine diphosphatase [Xanthomonadales bacterium]